MKIRTPLVALAVLGLPTAVAAQAPLTIGVRGGVSVASASVDLDQTFSRDNRTGFAGGLFVDYGAGPVGFQVALQYAQKGVDLDLGDAVRSFELDYLEIPAVLKLGLPLGALKPSVFGGAALGFKTGCQDDGLDCGDDIESTDLSGIAGADLKIDLGGASLWLDGRYHFGFSGVNSADDVVGDLKNRNWTLQAGLGFGFGG